MQMSPAILPYPKPHNVPQVDDYFGTAVPDPYRWLEELDSAETKAWVEAENLVTASYFEQLPDRSTLLQRMEQLTDYERFSAPSRYGTRYVYAHNSGLQNQAVVYWTEGLEGQPQVLIDPNTLAADGTVALGGLSVSEDGTLAALALSEAGSDWKRILVRDVATGKDLPDEIRWTKFGSPAWRLDGSGFYYAGYDAPPDGDPLKAVNHFPKIYFHKLGTPQSADAMVFERADDPEIFLHVSVTDDGRYLVISQHKGTSPNNSLALLDLDSPAAGVQQLIADADAAYSPIGNDGTRFWLYTTLDAPNGKVIAVDLAQPAREHWTIVVPESSSNLNGASLVRRTLILDYLTDAQSQVELYSEDGTHRGTEPLPGIGSVGGFGGRRDDAETFYTFTNFTTPGAIFRLDMETLESVVYRAPKLLFDPATYITEQAFVTSKDGTQVPLFLTYKRNLERDGNNPTLLYAYGGFNVSLTPAFSPVTIAWLERGGIYAQASLRGGGEYGEAWHAAGTRLQKQNVFDDFIACAEWLVAQRYTSSAKLAIQGGSNGGLLVGAMLTQRPELFGAANAAVGVMDMLRFDKFTVGWGWKQDYGSPSEDEAEFHAIHAYSPLHNLHAGTKYPATLITTADHDDRVYPAHSFKFAAAMQAAQAGAAPVLIRIETRAGHGAGMPVRKRLELSADTFAFFLHELGAAAD